MKKFGGKLSLYLGIVVFSFCLSMSAQALSTLSGTVTHVADGTPVVSMYVTATNTLTAAESWGYTDAAGNYSISVAAGNYDLATYTVSNESNVYFIQKMVTVTATDGLVTDTDFAVSRRARFSGNIYKVDGVTPIANVLVTATNIAGSSAGYSYGTYSTSAGYYIDTPTVSNSTQSAAGTYTINISATGYFSKTLSNVVLTDDQNTVNNVSLTAASTFSGTIKDANGVAVSGVTVLISDKNNAYNYYSATTNSSGIFSVAIGTTTSIGNFTVSISKTGYITQTDNLDITAESINLTDQNYTLVLGGIINGHVYASDGVTAINGATIYALDNFGNYYSTTSSTDGSYSLTGLRTSGTYVITVSKSGYLSNKSYNIEVTAGATIADQNYNLSDAATYSGTIVDAAGNPVESAYVYLYNREKSRSASYDYMTTTLSDGTFSITGIVPSKYRLSFSKTGYVTYQKEKLNLNASVSGKEYTMTKASSIYGRITNSGEPVVGLTVYIYGTKKNYYQGYGSATTDNNGYYYVTGLTKGTYRVDASSTDYLKKIVKTKVKKAQQKTLNIKLNKAGSISGYLWDDLNNLPLSYYTVRIVGSSASATTDYNGYYVIDGLKAGKYSAYVVSNWYDTEYQQNIVVKNNSITEDINFGLKRK